MLHLQSEFSPQMEMYTFLTILKVSLPGTEQYRSEPEKKFVFGRHESMEYDQVLRLFTSSRLLLGKMNNDFLNSH